MYETFLSGYGHTNPSMVTDSEGRLLIFCEDSRITLEKGREMSRVPAKNSMAAIARLRDGRLIGASYDDPKPERVLAAKLNGSTLSVAFSEDDGLSWSSPTPLCKTPGCYYVHNGRIHQLSTGRILVMANKVPESKFHTGIETADLSGAFYSDDNGVTWRESNWIDAQREGDHLAETIAVELPDGTVKSFMRSTSGYLRESVSRDGGATWEPEKATALRMPLSPFNVSLDPYTGFYFAIWINSFPAPDYLYPRSPLSLAVSRDNTESWEFLRDLEEDPHSNYGYPVAAYTPEGLALLYSVNSDSRSYNHARHRVKLKLLDRKEILK